MLKEQFLKLSDYNIWANDIIANYILLAGEAKADQVQVSSFPTIRKTMYHIWDAEVVWLKRLNNETLESWPPSAQFKGSLEEGLKEMLMNSKKLRSYVDRSSENNLNEEVTYSNTSNIPFKTKVCDVLTHCLNHGTYHRGQLITMLRVVGFMTVGSTDFITYCRAMEKLARS